MSKPMTEARLIQIGVSLRTIMRNLSSAQGCENAREYMQYLDMVDNVIAEVRRLRECIAKAPHAEDCNSINHKPELGFFKGCDCWQRQALGEQ